MSQTLKCTKVGYQKTSPIRIDIYYFCCHDIHSLEKRLLLKGNILKKKVNIFHFCILDGIIIMSLPNIIDTIEYMCFFLLGVSPLNLITMKS